MKSNNEDCIIYWIKRISTMMVWGAGTKTSGCSFNLERENLQKKTRKNKKLL